MKNCFVVVLIFAVIAGCVSNQPNESVEQLLKFDTTVSNVTFSVETQRVDSGYGYCVSIDGKKFIDQTIIPAIEGKHNFFTQQDALNTGKLVVNKMLTNDGLPSITVEDLIQLNVLSQEGNLLIKQ